MIKGRMLNYESNGTDHYNQSVKVTLASKLKDIKFPNKVKCSPYA